MIDERSCLDCRFGVSAPTTDDDGGARADCTWVFAEGEAGDRMPFWGWQILRIHPDLNGRAERADNCAAYEDREA